MQEFSVRSSNREELIDITAEVEHSLAQAKCKDGFCVVFVPHTTAGVTVNENADPDVVRDILYGLDVMVPQAGYRHAEGNSPAHIKSSMVGCSKLLIVKNCKLVLGTWQAVYFCEFDGPRQRRVLVTTAHG